MKISNVFDYSKVTFNKENEVVLMTSIKAPKVKKGKERAPLNLSLVLDVSGSMMGQKLDSVKKSVEKLIEQLSEKDSIAITTFGSYVEEIYAPSLMTAQNKANAIAQVRQLRTNGCTNMSGGVLKGFEQLKRMELKESHVHRLLLFTDGQANEGITVVEKFGEMITGQIKKTPITVSCFGYGNHDEVMLSNISDIGKGNFYFIDKVDDIAKTFARELGGLLTCYAQNISVYIDLKKKSGELLEVLNDLTCESPHKQRVKITLDDIYSEETKHLLVKAKLNKVTKAVTQRASSIIEVLVTYNDMTDNGKFVEKRAKGKIKFVKKEQADTEQAIEVVEQMALIELGKAHEKARLHADLGDFTLAQSAYLSVEPHLTVLRNSGSELGTIVGSAVNTATDSLTSTNYTSAVAKGLSNTARGLKSMRAVDASTSALYANSSQKDMEDIFSGASTTDGTVKGSSTTDISDSTIRDLTNGTAIDFTITSPCDTVTITGEGISIGSPFIHKPITDTSPQKNRGKQVRKRDGLNKRKSA